MARKELFNEQAAPSTAYYLVTIILVLLISMAIILNGQSNFYSAL